MSNQLALGRQLTSLVCLCRNVGALQSKAMSISDLDTKPGEPSPFMMESSQGQWSLCCVTCSVDVACFLSVCSINLPATREFFFSENWFEFTQAVFQTQWPPLPANMSCEFILRLFCLVTWFSWHRAARHRDLAHTAGQSVRAGGLWEQCRCGARVARFRLEEKGGWVQSGTSPLMKEIRHKVSENRDLHVLNTVLKEWVLRCTWLKKRFCTDDDAERKRQEEEDREFEERMKRKREEREKKELEAREREQRALQELEGVCSS